MHQSIRRALAIVILLSALSPSALMAQTPEPVDSELPPSIVQTELGVTRVGDTELIHMVKQLDIGAGAAIPSLSGMTSVVLTVQEGQLQVTPTVGQATVSVGTGSVIQADDGSTVCERPACDVVSGESVVIGEGNGFSIAGGSLTMETVGDEPVVVLVSVLLSESPPGSRCWICPGQ